MAMRAPAGTKAAGDAQRAHSEDAMGAGGAMGRHLKKKLTKELMKAFSRGKQSMMKSINEGRIGHPDETTKDVTKNLIYKK